MNILKLALATTALAFGLAGTANATITVAIHTGSATYVGPTPTYDFDTPGTTPVVSPSASIVNNNNLHAQPLGSTGSYFSAGPSTSNPSTIFLNGLGDIFTLSFIWGSIDDYNTLVFTDSAGTALVGPQYTFTGSEIAAMIPAIANGNQTANDTNPIVTFSFSGGDQSLVRGMQLYSTRNAFELDNIAVNAVPEPATWAMMLFGFGAVGFGMRRRNARKTALTQIA